ncbi:MAG: hypothetical protein WB679_13735, partial [Terracidiphilus sp.]
ALRAGDRLRWFTSDFADRWRRFGPGTNASDRSDGDPANLNWKRGFQLEQLGAEDHIGIGWNSILRS